MDKINTKTIEPEVLIPLVEAKAALWDQSSDGYKSKTLKQSAWREICGELNPDFEKMDEKERQEFGK